MVVFACNACGSSLKKNQVDKHCMSQCRNCESVSCMDCGKDFWGDEYRAHTKCISEDEKYGGMNYVPKASANKGEKKQEAWIEHVNNVIHEKGPSMDPRLRGLLASIVEYPNIPRKKPKFENFVKNSIFCRDPSLIAKAWDVFAASKENNAAGQQQKSQQQNEAKKPTEEKTEEKLLNGSTEEAADEPEKKLSKREKKEQRRKEQDKVEKKDKKGLKRKAEEEDEEPVEEEATKKKKKKLQAEEEQDAEENGVGEDEEDRPNKKKKKNAEVTGEEHVADGDGIVKKRKKKTKQDQEEDEGVDVSEAAENPQEEKSEEAAAAKPTKFKWEAVMTEVLTAAGGELPVKRLRKKVLSEYESRGGEAAWAGSKFEKKLKNSYLFKVLKDRVKLVSPAGGDAW